MPPDNAEDLNFEAENRRRRRAGLEPVVLPQWPHLPELYELEGQFTKLCVDNASIMPGSFVRRFFQLYEDTASLRFYGETPTRLRVLLESAAKILAEARAHLARAMGTREPGDDDGEI